MYDIRPFIEDNFQGAVLPYGETDVRVMCPFCAERYGSPDDKYKLHISLVKETCHCFRCDYTASWIRFVRDLTHGSTRDAIGLLHTVPNPADISKVVEQVYGDRAFIKRAKPVVDLPPITTPSDYVPLTTLPKTDLHVRYMRKRGFDVSHFTYYRIGIAPRTVPDRIYIPVEANYYQARAIFPTIQPKYMTPVMESDEYIFNSQALHLYRTVVITEGCLSAMATGRHAIALLGANPTRSKVARLVEATAQHYIITVEVGKEPNMVKLARQLQAYGKEVTMWYYPQEKDPADGRPTRVADYDMREHVAALLMR